MKKRVLSLALAISLCLSLFPTGALAEAFPQEETAAVSQTETPAPAETDEPQTVLVEDAPAAEQDENTDANESGEETVAADPGADGESDEENTTVEPTVNDEDAEESVAAAPGTDSESGEDSADIEPTTDGEDNENNENSTTDEPTPDGEKGAESVEGIAAQAADNEIAVFAGENVEPVAEVTTSQSTKTYTDISKAFEAVENTAGANFTVTLLTDVTLNGADKKGIIVPEDSITLDLNGKTIRQKEGLTNALIGLDSSVLYVQGGTLTIKDSDSAGNGKIVQPNTCPAVAVNGGKVIIQGGTFETTAGTYYDGLTTNDKNCAVYVAGGSATISGGTFTGGPGCKGSLAVEGGSSVKLSGGTYVARDANTPSLYNANGSAADLLENNYRFVDGNNNTVAGEGKAITGNVTVKEKPAGGVNYVDENGEVQPCENYKDLESAVSEGQHLVNYGWYVVKEKSDLKDGFEVDSDTVNLILCDGAELTGDSIYILGGGTLNIYGQSEGTGKLTLTSAGTPAIAPDDSIQGYDSATLNIYGGTITATSTENGAQTSPAIGLGEGPNNAELTVNIFGGTVKAQAPAGAQAIGRSSEATGAGTVTVTTADNMKCVKTSELNTLCAYDNTDGTSVTITKCEHPKWTYTNNGDGTHKKACTLCKTTDSAKAHTYTDWKADEDGTTHTGTCDCGATTTENHTITYTINADGLTHAAKCTKCDYTGASEPHTYDREVYSDGYYYKKCACGAFRAAEYNGQKYALLQAAIDAAKDGGTVKLLQDVGESVTVTDGTVTIDLDNKTWSNNQSGAPLTVEGGSVTLKNGTVQAGTGSRAANGIVLNDGSLILGQNMAVAGGKRDTTTSLHAIQVNDGNLTLSEYVVLANGLQVPADKTLGDYLPDGMAFMQCTYNPGAVGGSSDYVPEVYTSNAYTGNMRVEAHTHTNIDANGKCVCGLQYAAKITRDNADSFYAMLPAAITALANGDTLTLLTDVNADNGVTIDKSVTFDLNEKTLSGSSGELGLLTVEGNTTVTVKNGTLESNAGSVYAIHVQGWSTNLTLVAVTARNSINDDAVLVNQGGLTIESGSYERLYLNPDVRVTLKGGTFTSIYWPPNSFGGASKDCTELLAEGCVYYKSGTTQQFRTAGSIDTEVTVGEGTYTPVAKIGEKEYISLQAALREAKNGETITLSENLDLGNGTVLLQERTGKNFTIDLNSHTLSGNGDYLVFIYEYSGHLTLKNGTLDGSSCTGEYGVVRVSSKNNPTLTLKNVKATSSKNNVPIVGALGGTVEFDGGNYTGGVLIQSSGNVILKRGTFDKGANSYSIKTGITGKTLNDYLDEGSAFWDGDTITAVSGASSAEKLTVKPTPIRSVTAEKAEVTTEFGLTKNITLKASVAQPEEGGTTLQWYTVEGNTPTEIAGENSNTYKLPADLAPNTYHYRLTATKDGYSKSCDFTVTVNKANIANAKIKFTYENCGGSAPWFNPLGTGVWVGTRQSADGSVVKKDYKVTLNGKELTEGKDFTVVENSNIATNAGTHTLKIAGTGNYARTTSADWEILPYVLEDIYLSPYMKEYDGKPVTLEGSPLDEPEQYFAGDEKYNTYHYIKLAKGTDLTITNYSDTFTSAEANSEGDVTFTVTLKNSNYTFKDADGNDTKSKTFTRQMSIRTQWLNSLPSEYQPATGSLRVANGVAGTYTYDFSQLLKTLPEGLSYGTIKYWLYDGSATKPNITLTEGYYTDGVTLDEQTGIMTLPINAVNTTALGNIGTVKIVVRTNNFVGFPVTLNVSTANPVTVSGITASDKVYDGTTDVTLDCSNAAFDGVFGNDTLTVTAKGAFASANAGEQKVVISDLTLGGADADKYILVQNGQQTETTAAITPKDVTVTLTPNGGTYGSVTPAAAKLNGLVAGDDPAITLTYTGSDYDAADVPTHAGRYTVKATLADGNYNLTGTTTAAFVIAPRSIKDATVVLGQGLVANGKAQTQTVAKVLVDGREIPADAYTVTGNTATAPGSYTLTITAKDGGDYTGSITASYVVAPAPADQTPGGESGGASGGTSAGDGTKQSGTAQNTPQTGSGAEPSTMTAVPKTADASNPMLYVVLWAAALAGLAATAFAASANKRSGKR